MGYETEAKRGVTGIVLSPCVLSTVNDALAHAVLCSVWYGISPMHSEISGPIAIFATLEPKNL